MASQPQPPQHGTIACPACGKQIIPQWTYRGRDFVAIVRGVGIESHRSSRMCPLCGVDIDGFAKEQKRQAERQQREETERRRRASLTPFQRFKEWAIDRILLVLSGIILTALVLLLVASC